MKKNTFGSEKPEVEEDLDRIEFKGLENVKCGSAVTVYIRNGYLEHTACRSSFLRLFKEYLKYGYNIEVKGNEPKIVFLFSNSYDSRDDYIYWWNKVRNLSLQYAYFSPSRKLRNPFRYIGIWLYVLSWFNSMNILDEPFSFKMAVLPLLMRCYIEKREITRMLDSKGIEPKLFLTLCDVHMSDSVLTQYFNYKMVDTATLQHGFYDQNSFTFTNSFSKYMLVWGPVTAKRAIAMGVSVEKLLQLGAPHFIDEKKYTGFRKAKTGCFAAFLNGSAYSDDNMRILEAVKTIAEEYSMGYYVRLHPALDRMQYKEFCSHEYFRGFMDNSESVKSSLEEYDFAVSGNSSITGELIYYMMPCFRLVSKEVDMYGDCGMEFCWADSCSMLQECLKHFLEDPDKMEKLFRDCRERLYSTGDIAENYRTFFANYTEY